MRLVIDLQATQSPTHSDRGIARYAAELTLGLVDIGADIALIGLNPDLPLPPSLPPRLLSHPAVGWTKAAAIESVAGEAAYLTISPVENAPLRSILPDPVRRRGLPVVAILHDLIPLLFPDRYLRERPWSPAGYRQRLEVYRTADLVLANSECSRADGIRLLGLDPGRVSVIHGGVSSFFRPPTTSSAPPGLPGMTGPYVLCVGGEDPRKNLDGLVRAWGSLGPRYHERLQLVIVCTFSEGARRVLLEQARVAGAPPGSVLLTGHVDDLALRRLYQHATLSVLPSHYEGLGLPVLEGLACGCPTITSSTSSLPEILGLASSTFDPDPDHMAAAMVRALDDQGLRREILERAALRLPEYTWNETAVRCVKAIELLGRPARVAVRPRRPIIAIVGPVPPSVAGPAVYTSRIVRSLVTVADVVLVDSENRRHGTVEGVRCVPARAVGGLFRLEEVDHVVTLFGNSEHYAEGFELHRRRPSVAWLHEVRLAAILTTRAARVREGPERVRDEAERAYEGRIPVIPVDQWLDPGRLAALAVGFSDIALATATAVVVQSELALRLLKLDQRGRPLPPAAILPHAFLDPAILRASDPQEPLLIVALGIVSPVKAPEVLLDAVAILREDLDVRLAFVGPEGTTGAVIRARAEAIGIDGALTVTGEVSEEVYLSWVGRASLGVQLRRTSYGESSGAVTDLLSCGVPCVTSVATAAELPEGAVELVPPDVDAEHLATVLASVLGDRQRREAMATAGRELASRWTHRHVAMALLPTLESLATAAEGTVIRPG